jgi:hypothetical protein
VREVAKERGGKCLSKEYVNNETPLLWECAKGHRWEAQPASIVNVGTWCPVCGRRNRPRLGIERMREVARERGGKCLTKEYVNSHTHLLWECAEGHRWQALPANVINRGTWCFVCVSQVRPGLGIERMREVARERAGRCLSKEYVNSRTPLLWQCASGHSWKAIPNSINRGTWCPLCARNRRKAKARTGENGT